MKSRVMTVVLAALASLVVLANADQAAKHKTTTLTGEVVDTGCYLGHEARGAKHVACATKCINNGMPMGILTAQGALYLVTLNHDNPDPYNQLKGMAGKTVTVTGVVIERGGMKGVDVTGVKPSPAKAG